MPTLFSRFRDSPGSRLCFRSTLCFFPFAFSSWSSPAFPVRTFYSLRLSPPFVPLRPAPPLTSSRSFSRCAFAHRQAPQTFHSRFWPLISSLSCLFFRLGSLCRLLCFRSHPSDDFLSLLSSFPILSATRQHFLASCSFEPDALPASCFQASFVLSPSAFLPCFVCTAFAPQHSILYTSFLHLSNTFLKKF